MFRMGGGGAGGGGGGGLCIQTVVSAVMLDVINTYIINRFSAAAFSVFFGPRKIC